MPEDYDHDLRWPPIAKISLAANTGMPFDLYQSLRTAAAASGSFNDSVHFLA